jgi:hypothetical protein
VIYEENIAVLAKQNCLSKGLGLQCMWSRPVVCKAASFLHCHSESFHLNKKMDRALTKKTSSVSSPKISLFNHFQPASD